MNARILIVDANDNLRMTMARVLKLKGHEVQTTSENDHAIDLALKVGKFDLIFMNVQQPLKVAIEAYETLRNILTGSVVFMMTSFEIEKQLREQFRDGQYNIISTPDSNGLPLAVDELVDEAILGSTLTCLHKPLDMLQVFSIIDGVLTKRKEVSDWIS